MCKLHSWDIQGDARRRGVHKLWGRNALIGKRCNITLYVHAVRSRQILSRGLGMRFVSGEFSISRGEQHAV